MPVPIEVVVVRRDPEVSDQRSGISRARDPSDPEPGISALVVSSLHPEPGTRDPEPDPRPPTPDLTPEQQRELDALHEVTRCLVRRRVLLSLAADGPANVGQLARRTGISPKTLSHHLGLLRTAGLVFNQRVGRHMEYEVVATRVRFERHADGTLSLTVTAHGGGVAVTITVRRANINSGNSSGAP